MTTLTCQACECELLSIKTEQDQLIRCSSCGFSFLPSLTGEEAVQKTDRMAKWSFWLGISSLLLCFTTGIPALILGIRSWRRMRFRVTKKGEKRQAIVGTILGLITGVLGGLFAMVMGTLALLFFLTFEQTEDPDRIMALLEDVAVVELLEDLHPKKGFGVLGQKRFKFSDKPNDGQAESVIFEITEMHMQPSMSNLQRILDNQFTGNINNYEVQTTVEIKDWDVIDGESVIKTLFVNPGDPTDRIYKYTYGQKTEMSLFGLGIVFRESSGISEDQVKELFESVSFKKSEK